jgi:hypothetical protein
MKIWTGALLLLLCAGRLQAQEVDLQQLVRDTQITRQASPNIDLVWWIPTDYWRESLRKSAMTSQQQQELVKTIDGYLIVAVLEGTVGTLGVLSSTSKDALAKKMSITVGDKTQKPIDETDLTPGARNFIQMMKPVLANMMGAMGEGLHLMPFNGKDAAGRHLVDPRSKGRISVKIGEKEFPFRLPLGSLLPARFDPDSGERFPGDYEFSPYSGKKLTVAK